MKHYLILGAVIFGGLLLGVAVKGYVDGHPSSTDPT